MRPRYHDIYTAPDIVGPDSVPIAIPDDVPFKIRRVGAEHNAEGMPSAGAANTERHHQ